MNKRRANMYSLLSRLYKKEADEKLLKSLSAMTFPSGNDNELLKGYTLIGSYIKTASDLLTDQACLVKTQEELAVDFARVFLAAGIAKGEAAFPFESVYTSKKKIVMQEAWEDVKRVYATRDVGLLKEDGELLEDHISCELEYMAYLISENAGAKEQLSFLEAHLVNWVPAFTADMERFATTDFYKGLALLTRGIVMAECELLKEESTKTNAEVSVRVANDQFDHILKKLSEKYTIYAPKHFMTGAGEKKVTIKYAKIQSLSEIVYDRQSDFSPKESYYPISQTMFYFTETEVIEAGLKDDKGILVFARPCDINAMDRLDNIFLNNGGKEDVYYARLHNKVKVIMLECRESFEHCFCVSLGTNKTNQYDAAVRFRESDVLVQVKDAELNDYFAEEEAFTFAPEFVTENKKKLNIPQINDRETLKWASDHEFWNKFDDKCIGCGGCNTVCGTCSCFDTVDIIYNEGSKEGERKRVWSGCMLEDFTQTAGGARARKTPGANMRFKTFHKFYDYKARFGGEQHMCVGCGRCTRRCPAELDFFETVNELAELIEGRDK